MLQICRRFSDLDVPKLMEVYRQSNLENGAFFYPRLSSAEGLFLVEEDFRDYLREDFFQRSGAFYCLWLEKGRILSALRLEPYEDGLLLQALETHPDYRKQGCARKLMEAVQQLLEEQTVYSHVSKENRPSLAVHRRCGFAVHKDSARYLDGSVSANAWTLRWSPTMKK